MAMEPLGLASVGAYGNAEFLAAYGIAINLAYLNLPNLRFPSRIKIRIQNVIHRYDIDYASINAESPQYKGIHELAELSEDRDLPLPTAPQARKDGGFLVNLFMLIWCTPVQLSFATQPVDKLISAIFFGISNLYLFYLIVTQVYPNDVSFLQDLFLVFELSVLAIVIFSAIRLDLVTAVIPGLALGGCHLSLYYPGAVRFLPDAASPVHMLGLLTASIVVTALLVAFSHMLYPVAERYFVQQTNEILEDAKSRAALKSPAGAGVHR